ncbi:hypothetical protein [uncultured Selenomonas sp.]|jgi:hypothetical protein|uniref:hypothetical protein n=1 Tax=uncultured Selenomonas sp. TaxID=159275 RepID=UPI0028053363|nr:hypothetical protein [uncultured Selenomonas sp.]
MALQQIKSFFLSHWKELLILLSIFIMGVLLWRVNTLERTVDNKTQQVKVMDEKHAEDLNSLRNQLNLNKQNAETLQKRIIEAQHGLRQPEMVYKEVVSYGDSPVKVIEEKLATGDSTLPPEALEKTDRTVVVEQKDNPEIPVGIYKINTYKNWEVGTGIGVQNDNPYIPLSVQRNYDRNHSIMLEAHYGLKDQQVNGGEVQWKIHF